MEVYSLDFSIDLINTNPYFGTAQFLKNTLNKSFLVDFH